MSECNCEGGDGYTEKAFVCDGCKRAEESGGFFIGTKDLKPCPFCGKEAIVFRRNIGTRDFYSIACIDAAGCSEIIEDWLDLKDLMAHWNMRAKL